MYTLLSCTAYGYPCDLLPTSRVLQVFSNLFAYNCHIFFSLSCRKQKEANKLEAMELDVEMERLQNDAQAKLQEQVD